MDFLEKLVLPQSAHHIQLIHYLLIAIFFLFIPYIGTLLISGILSLIYWHKGKSSKNELYLNYAASVIRIPTLNKSIGFVLGILPFLTITFMISQIMHGADTHVLQLLFIAFIMGTIGVILIYAFRYTLDFERLYTNINEKIADSQINSEINEKSNRVVKLANKTGLWGIIFLFGALWLIFATTAMIINPPEWNAGLLSLIFSPKVFLFILQFLAVSCSLTGSVMLFAYFYWEGGVTNLEQELQSYIKKISLRITLWGSLILPLIIPATLVSLNSNYLSGSIFTLSSISLILLLIVYNLLYGIVKEKNIKYSGLVFFLLLLTAFSIIIKDQAAMSNATEQQALILDTQFQEYLAGLTGNRNVAEVSGKEIYDVRCSSCHRFDQKLVGPAYKDVLPKYEGKTDLLTGFILNPVKKNPQFPPMPNPGLKPNEAKAVTSYIMETYKK